MNGSDPSSIEYSPEPATRRLAYAAVTSAALATAGTLPVIAAYGGDSSESAANSATAQLVVNDREAPKIRLPANQTIQVDIDSTTARFNYTVSVTDNRPGSISLFRTAGPASGSSLPLGTTTFTFFAMDPANNSVNQSFTVTVVARRLNGGNGNDSLYGSANADTMNGGDGNDLLDGKRGADTMNGGKGNDTYYVDNAGDKVVEKPREGTDKVITALSYELPANVEKLTLTGSAAEKGTGNGLANTIEGNVGANRLTGGGDADVIKGGKGADRFVYEELSDSTARDPDTISDFRKTDKDRIDLAAIDANSRKAGNQAFTFIGEEAFSKTAGELRFAKRRLEADVNGDGKADFVIKVQTRSLTAKEILR